MIYAKTYLNLLMDVNVAEQLVDLIVSVFRQKNFDSTTNSCNYF